MVFLPSRLTKEGLLYCRKIKARDITSNYRLITCLPLIGKLFLGVNADEVYENLDLEELMIYFILIGQ